MRYETFQNLDLGLYIIYWKSGGESIASIGYIDDGRRWLAPANWLAPLMPNSPNYKQQINGISYVEQIITIRQVRELKLQIMKGGE